MARYNSWTGKTLTRGLHQRQWQVERLESRALLTGGINIGDYVVDEGLYAAEKPAAEVAIVSPATETYAVQTAPPCAEDSPRNLHWGARELPPCTADAAVELEQDERDPPADEEEPLVSTDVGNADKAAGTAGDETEPTAGSDKTFEFSPKGDQSVPPPAAAPLNSSAPVSDPPASTLMSWPTPQSSPAAARNRADTAAASQPELSQEFHYFQSHGPRPGSVTPALSGHLLAEHLAHDTVMALALLPPSSSQNLTARDWLDAAADRSPQQPQTLVAVSPAAARGDAQLAASEATVARAEAVVRSIDAALAELVTETASATAGGQGLPPALLASVMPRTDSAVEVDGKQAIPESQTLRLGFFALTSLVLTSRWGPPAIAKPLHPAPRLSCRLQNFLKRMGLKHLT